MAGALYAWGASGGAEHYYYAAAVRSMSESWHAFAFGALDPTGAITADKLPGMLWVQALCVRLFGFSTGVLPMPHVVAATGTVLALYGSVRRWAGGRPALMAGVAPALTPISYATARGMFPDTMLVCCLTVAAYLLTRALESRRTGWLIGAGLMIGLGFQMKMLAALVPLPAFVAAPLLADGSAARERLRRAALLTAVSLAACLPWLLLVSATPPAERPWPDGTADNSVWRLVFGHNGLDRAGAALAPFGGEPGPAAAAEPQLGGQIGWLLPLALAGVVAALVTGRARREPQWSLWGGWLVLGAVAINAAGGVHPYYTTLLAVLVTGGLAALLARRARAVPTAVAVAAHDPHRVVFDKLYEASARLRDDPCVLLPSVHAGPHVTIKHVRALPITVQYTIGPTSRTSFEAVDRRIRALSDPSRVRICREVLRGRRTTVDLAHYTGMPEPQVSRHLRRPREAGLVRTSREGRMVYYELETDAPRRIGEDVYDALWR